ATYAELLMLTLELMVLLTGSRWTMPPSPPCPSQRAAVELVGSPGMVAFCTRNAICASSLSAVVMLLTQLSGGRLWHASLARQMVLACISTWGRGAGGSSPSAGAALNEPAMRAPATMPARPRSEDCVLPIEISTFREVEL